MLTEGIAALKEKGAQVRLSYGKEGLCPTWGGGNKTSDEGNGHARFLAQRMANNVVEWDLDGVDIFTGGWYSSGNVGYGKNVAFHYHVIKQLRKLLPADKTISYTIFTPPAIFEGSVVTWFPMETIIVSSHKYLDSINIQWPQSAQDAEDFYTFLTNELDVPASKIGMLITENHIDSVWDITNSIKEKGFNGVSLFSVNKENELYGGNLLKLIAGNLYI